MHYSVRMRAAQGGSHENGGRHISGAERLIPRELLLEVLLVEDARGRGHPLHVAGADAAPAPRRIPVRDAARVDDGHRLETPVRVRPNPEPLPG